MDEEKFSVLYYRDGALLAVDAVNNPVDYMVVRKALTQGVSIPAERRTSDEARSAKAVATRAVMGAPTTARPFRGGSAHNSCVADTTYFRREVI